MTEYSTLAAVDLGSNSFHCQVARVVGEQLYPLDALREPVRLGAGLTADHMLDAPSQERALDCLQRFGERLRGFDPGVVRAIGTNTLRVAKNAGAFLRKAESALGFPIEVVAGREEARLIYLGVAHSLPASKNKRLVVDVGGGSTECIIGSLYKPQKLESLFMGCVSYSLAYFPDGRLTKGAFKQAETAARNELQPIVSTFSARSWQEAVGSSGTLRAIAEMLQLNHISDGEINQDGIERLRAQLIKAGHVDRVELAGLRPDRRPVLPGGMAIIGAVLSELDIGTMTVAPGAMREGILHDLLGRVHHHDLRDATVAQFMQRYHVDALQSRRVATLAAFLYGKLTRGDEVTKSAQRYLAWAARLHELGISVAYSGYQKHTAYILEKADMPGFSRDEQKRLALLVLAHRRSLKKILPQLEGKVDWNMVLALRLAVLFYRRRTDIGRPVMNAAAHGRSFKVTVDADWLQRHPLTVAVLREEVKEWEKIGFELAIPGLERMEAGSEAA